MIGLKEKTILVTGASSGLGRAIAERLHTEGAGLILIGRNEERLNSVLPDSTATRFLADLADETSLSSLIRSLKASSPIHGWVLAAGVSQLRPLMMESPERLTALWKTNVMSGLGLMAGAIKSRIVAPGGSIVLFSSSAASSGGSGLVSYASTKSALEGAVRSLAVELAPQRIRVNGITPGVVDTPMSKAFLERLTQAQIDQLRARHPLGFGTPKDVAGPVSWLLSEDSLWVTGSILAIDGGFSAT